MPEIPLVLARVRDELTRAANVLGVGDLLILRGILADTAEVIDGRLAPAAPVDNIPHNAETAP